MKIVMSEVTAAKTSIESSKTKLQSQINSAKSSWKGVVSSDGLSGSVKLAIDAEINNYQMPLLTNYYDAMHQLSTEFTKAISDFKSTVKETSGSAIIDTDALTTAESKFSDQLTKFTEIEAKFKTVYSSISDLVSVSEVSGSGFTEEMEKTKKVLTNTKTWMATFNGKKSSKAISSILSQQKAQIRSLKSVAGLSYTDPKSLEIYQSKAFKNKVSKQHKAVKEFEKKKLEAERAELLRKHPANAAISGHLSLSEINSINKEINKQAKKATHQVKEVVWPFAAGFFNQWANNNGKDLTDATFGKLFGKIEPSQKTQNKKSYNTGVFWGNIASFAQGGAEFIGGGLWFFGGNGLSIAGAPATGGGSLAAVPVVSGSAAAMMGHGGFVFGNTVRNVMANNGYSNEKKADTDSSKKTYRRPSGYRKGVRDKVWDNAKGKDGVVRDPLTKKPLKPNEPWDMDKPGYEFKKHQKSAADRKISRPEFLDEHNNPSHYRPELPSSNRGHAGEDATNKYFGP